MGAICPIAQWQFFVRIVSVPPRHWCQRGASMHMWRYNCKQYYIVLYTSSATLGVLTCMGFCRYPGGYHISWQNHALRPWQQVMSRESGCERGISPFAFTNIYTYTSTSHLLTDNKVLFCNSDGYCRVNNCRSVSRKSLYLHLLHMLMLYLRCSPTETIPWIDTE